MLKKILLLILCATVSATVSSTAHAVGSNPNHAASGSTSGSAPTNLATSSKTGTRAHAKASARADAQAQAQVQTQTQAQAQAQANTPTANATLAKKKMSIEQELQQDKILIKKLKQQMSSLQLKESEVMNTLQTIEAELKTQLKSLEETEALITNGEKEYSLLQESMNTLNKSFHEKLLQFSKQMKAAYLFKKNSPMKLFLSQQNPYHIDRLLQYYRYMEKHSYETLSQLLNEMHTLSVHQNELDALNTKIKELKESKLALISTQKAQKEAHHTALQTLQKDLTQTVAALSLSQKNEAALQSKLDTIKAAIADKPYKNNGNPLPFFQPGPFTKAQGKLLWPIRLNPRPSLMSPFMIKAKAGDSVLAAYEGRVVFADRLRGFGLLVIIDHGEGYLSLYGQNQTLYKNVGDAVKRGDMIARVGGPAENTSSELTDSGLYFEVRKNGKPINLVNWFN